MIESNDYVIFDDELTSNTIADIWEESMTGEHTHSFGISYDVGGIVPPTGMMANLSPTSNAVVSINKVYTDKLKNNMLPLNLSHGQHPRDSSDQCVLKQNDGWDSGAYIAQCHLLREWNKVGQFKNPKEKVIIPCESYLNYYQPREMPYYHNDGNCSTLIYYVNPEFNYDEAGETKFIINKHEVITIPPVPGRILIFNGNIYHAAVCRRTDVRLTIVLKYYWF